MLKRIVWRALEIGVSPWLERYLPPLRDTGWIRSRLEGRCVDLAGDPVPWITYPAINFLSRRVKSGFDVFEYGCGMSTLWWARRVHSVVSAEHDENWARKIAEKAQSNTRVVVATGEAYPRAARDQGRTFDVVVIDAIDRVACVPHAVAALKPDGIIVFDNSDRAEYAEGFTALGEAGFRRLEFVGIAPMINYEMETSIFYRQRNCVGL